MAEPFVAFIAGLCHYKAVWEYVQIKKILPATYTKHAYTGHV